MKIALIFHTSATAFSAMSVFAFGRPLLAESVLSDRTMASSRMARSRVT